MTIGGLVMRRGLLVAFRSSAAAVDSLLRHGEPSILPECRDRRPDSSGHFVLEIRWRFTPGLGA
jgi:hypothetical protein